MVCSNSICVAPVRGATFYFTSNLWLSKFINDFLINLKRGSLCSLVFCLDDFGSLRRSKWGCVFNAQLRLRIFYLQRREHNEKNTALILVVCICLSFCACGDDAGRKKGNGGAGQTTKQMAKEISPGVVDAYDCRIEITDYDICSYVGGTAGFVFIIFTNNSDESCSLNDVVKIKVYQNGVECRNASMYEFSIGSSEPFEVDDYADVLPGVTAKTGELFKIQTQTYNQPVLVQIIVAGEVISEVTLDPAK